MALSVDEFANLVARTRRTLEARGELRPPKRGPLQIHLPQSIRDAIAADLAAGNYERAVRETTGDDPEMTDP